MYRAVRVARLFVRLPLSALVWLREIAMVTLFNVAEAPVFAIHVRGQVHE